MAIQVGGTTVINNSRVLQNVSGLKTINSTSILGSGDISVSGSTTWNAVGTYALARFTGSTDAGGTTSGANLDPASTGTISDYYSYSDPNSNTVYISNGNSAPCFYYSSTMSGTWRCMGNGRKPTSTYNDTVSLWVRIS